VLGTSVLGYEALGLGYFERRLPFAKLDVHRLSVFWDDNELMAWVCN
jgi:hypothetical protein